MFSPLSSQILFPFIKITFKMIKLFAIPFNYVYLTECNASSVKSNVVLSCLPVLIYNNENNHTTSILMNVIKDDNYKH